MDNFIRGGGGVAPLEVTAQKSVPCILNAGCTVRASAF
jgi:hypothetical protein